MKIIINFLIHYNIVSLYMIGLLKKEREKSPFLIKINKWAIIMSRRKSGQESQGVDFLVSLCLK